MFPRSPLFGIVCLHTIASCTPPPSAPSTPTAAPGPDPCARGLRDDANAHRADRNVPQPKTHFEYDSANVRDADLATLGTIAKCMREGNLQGRRVEVVGRTDARGPSEYNRQLGKSRADAVTELLSEKGVEKATIITRSTGEARAQGTDEEGFASDRRVDIRLVKEGDGAKMAPRP